MLRFGRLFLLSVFLLALCACGRFGFDWASDSSWVFPADQDPPFGGAEVAQLQVDASGARLERLSGFAELDARLSVPAAAGAVATIGSRFFFAGGNEAFPSDNGCNDLLSVLDPDSGQLESLADLPMAKRGLGLVAYADQLFVLMGFCSGQSDTEEAKVYRFNPDTGLYDHLADFTEQVYYLSAG